MQITTNRSTNTSCPPSLGNDVLEVGGQFVMSTFEDRTHVLTADPKSPSELRIKKYDPDCEYQQWKCVQNDKHHFGLINVATGKFLGRDRHPNLAVVETHQGAAEQLVFISLHSGFRLCIEHHGKMVSATLKFDRGGAYMKMNAAPKDATPVGLHRLQYPFTGFEWVIPNRLARSSAPYYKQRDSDQRIDDVAIGTLKARGICRVVSLNSSHPSREERSRLSDAGIRYLALPTCAALTLLDLYALVGAAGDDPTIVWCGDGESRTGMAICALLIKRGWKLTGSDFDEQRVKTQASRRTLELLRDWILADPKYVLKDIIERNIWN